MRANKTVTINGRLYDTASGLPVEKTARTTDGVKRVRAAANKSGTVHATPQRSQTLHRRAVKKQVNLAQKRNQPGKMMDFARSTNVKRFAKHPSTPVEKTEVTPDTPAKAHPVAKKALSNPKTPSAPAKTSKKVKEEVITAALKNSKKPSEHKKRRFTWGRKTFITIGIFLFLIAGAVTAYITLPSISVAIASTQAGVEASYPKYTPDGYSLAQPVTFSDGEVVLKFTSNSGSGDYSIAQTNSSWDSSAVLDNVVRPASGDNYVINQERGLTIYAYDGNATWVNGGILYTIDSSAPLSGDQIRRIAISL